MIQQTVLVRGENEGCRSISLSLFPGKKLKWFIR